MAELMYEATAAYDCAVVHNDFTGKLCGVADDYVVTYDTVMLGIWRENENHGK